MTRRREKAQRKLSRKAQRLARERGGTHQYWMLRLTTTSVKNDEVIDNFNPFKKESQTHSQTEYNYQEDRQARLAKLRVSYLQARKEKAKAIAESGLTPAEYDELQALEALTHEELQEAVA